MFVKISALCLVAVFVSGLGGLAKGNVVEAQATASPSPASTPTPTPTPTGHLMPLMVFRPLGLQANGAGTFTAEPTVVVFKEALGLYTYAYKPNSYQLLIAKDEDPETAETVKLTLAATIALTGVSGTVDDIETSTLVKVTDSATSPNSSCWLVGSDYNVQSMTAGKLHFTIIAPKQPSTLISIRTKDSVKVVKPNERVDHC